jgi:putative tryptophan/tyrosine transport system substrate-binding protein
MRRREFIVGLGGAAAWPLVARAQQPERVRRIAVLMNLAADDPEALRRVAAFKQGLQDLGWTDGRNVRFDYRWGPADADGYRRYAAELVALAPDVILAQGTTILGPLQQVTRTVPIVFSGAVDPVGGGFVDSLARPGGNATGFNAYEYSLSGKWPELLKQIAPSVTRVAVLRDPVAGSGTAQFAVIQTVAQLHRMEITAIDVRDVGEIERAVTAFARGSNDGLIVTRARWRKLIVNRSSRLRLATACPRSICTAFSLPAAA